MKTLLYANRGKPKSTLVILILLPVGTGGGKGYVQQGGRVMSPPL